MEIIFLKHKHGKHLTFEKLIEKHDEDFVQKMDLISKTWNICIRINETSQLATLENVQIKLQLVILVSLELLKEKDINHLYFRFR